MADVGTLQQQVAVTELRTGVWSVALPLPLRLDAVNAYVLRDDDLDGWCIIDAGLGLHAAELWSAALEAVGITPGDVSRIIITHYHPDHIGGSGPLAQLTGAPVLASAFVVTGAQHVWGPGQEAAFAAIDQHALDHGFPRARMAELDGQEQFAMKMVRVPDVMEALTPGTELRLAGGTWTVHEMPGHSPGHLVLLEPGRGELLAGDHLLETISPAVGHFPAELDNPLDEYLHSLRRTAELPIQLVLPGHRQPFADAAGRCSALIAHHEERLEQCVAAVGNGPASANDVARVVFGEQADPQQERFAQAEALAHLEYARQSNERLVLERSPGGIWQFHPA